MTASVKAKAKTTIDPEQFDAICLAASEARNLIWGHDRTLSYHSFRRVVRAGADEQGLRAAVLATLHAAGLKPPKMDEVGIHR